MKSEEEENVLFKSMITKYNSVIDGIELMFCSYQERIPKEISTGTSGSRVFETNYWCMFAGIEELLSDVIMQGETKQLSWDVKDNEGIGEMIFKSMTTEHNPIVKEDESCIQPVAQTIGEIEFSEEMKMLEEMTEIKEFLAEK